MKNMENKKGLTEEDLHILLTAKIKEPGIGLEQLYKDISKIHPKPKLKFYITLLISVIGYLSMLFVSNFTFCSIAFLLFVISIVCCIILQKKHFIIEMHWSLMGFIALISLYLSREKLVDIGIFQKVIDLVANLFTKISGIS